MADIKIAERAFVRAVAEALKIQEQMLQLRMRLQQVDSKAQHANDSALNEAGFTEESEFDEVMDAQERWLRLAIEEANLPEDSPVVQAASGQIKAARAQFAVDKASELEQLGRIQGPEV